ncbi:ABC transporter substrate-binding protein [Paenarthrobacter sp. Z7-10]|uniref:ABC transporter substrate-binding protein n=1 Tax=Paenarthrobacter sp. Z7-10 TaxID=2787635 RepID=UPI0022A90F4A|nr:ABC transporter substrate-binding protein [Paenarthrobacter sp. Z7-10]MCZ2402287.1 ABC transporter substrate-binding protein [Paenarthrobacter sp. Z7-10]
MATKKPAESAKGPRTRRIVAGEKRPRRRALEGAMAAGLALLIGAGAVVASVSAEHRGKTVPVAEIQQRTPAAKLRLGYFGNVTHAPALVGLQQGFFAKELGTTKLSSQVFNAGPAAVEALNAGAIDAAYLGPNPAINSYATSRGASLRIIAGAASGGAELVVKPGINSAADLKGKVLASPQLGGTQDVALRSWLTGQGLETRPGSGGDVTINPTDNAQTLKLFQDGQLDGAWLPEPWASRLVRQAGAKVLVDEKDLWDGGQFASTVLVVSVSFVHAHPQTVEQLLRGHVESVSWLQDHPGQAESVINAGLQAAAGSPLPPEVIKRALSKLVFTVDPLANTFHELLQHGVDAGVTKPADINGIFDLRLLNKLRSEAGQPDLSPAGLGLK